MMNLLLLLCFVSFSTLQFAAAQQLPLGPLGTVAAYELVEEPADRPAFPCQHRRSGLLSWAANQAVGTCCSLSDAEAVLYDVVHSVTRGAAEYIS